jgi:uncharacterized membrane protein YedE/YeeE
MLKNLKKATWNPYIAGIFVGILAVISVIATTLILGKAQYIGASTTYVRLSGFVEQMFSKEHVLSNEYFQSKKIKVDWQMMLVFGIFIGSMTSSVMGKDFKLEKLPPMWEEKFGKSSFKRGIVAFIGGFIAMFGARLAGGCPSGHGLSGVMQLAVSGFIAMCFFIIGGIFVARLIYERRK